MKKIIYIALLLAACKSAPKYDGIYVSHTNGQFSIADDTLVIADTVIINHTGFQKIRNGQSMPRAHKTRQWTINSPDAPPMRITEDKITIGSTIYKKLP